MPGISAFRFNLRVALIALIFVLLLLPPLLNALPAGHPLRVSDFVVAVTGKWICYAILALSIDLAWGCKGRAHAEQCRAAREAVAENICHH